MFLFIGNNQLQHKSINWIFHVFQHFPVLLDGFLLFLFVRLEFVQQAFYPGYIIAPLGQIEHSVHIYNLVHGLSPFLRFVESFLMHPTKLSCFFSRRF